MPAFRNKLKILLNHNNQGYFIIFIDFVRNLMCQKYCCVPEKLLFITEGCWILHVQIRRVSLQKNACEINNITKSLHLKVKCLPAGDECGSPVRPDQGHPLLHAGHHPAPLLLGHQRPQALRLSRSIFQELCFRAALLNVAFVSHVSHGHFQLGQTFQWPLWKIKLREKKSLSFLWLRHLVLV